MKTDGRRGYFSDPSQGEDFPASLKRRMPHPCWQQCLKDGASRLPVFSGQYRHQAQRVPPVRRPHGQVFVRGVEFPRFWGPGRPNIQTALEL